MFAYTTRIGVLFLPIVLAGCEAFLTGQELKPTGTVFANESSVSVRLRVRDAGGTASGMVLPAPGYVSEIGPGGIEAPVGFCYDDAGSGTPVIVSASPIGDVASVAAEDASVVLQCGDGAGARAVVIRDGDGGRLIIVALGEEYRPEE